MRNGLMVVALLALVAVVGAPRFLPGQASGNANYSGEGGRNAAEARERSKRVQTKTELPPESTTSFVEANVLLNVKADEYVAVFAIVQEAETLAACNEKMNATVAAVTAAVTKLGIDAKDLFVDFIAQAKIYGHEAEGDVLREKLVGFTLKKNILIHFKDYALLDPITLAAAQSNVFDLVKVDYIVTDAAGVREQLLKAAAGVVKSKVAQYETLLGVKLVPPAQIYAEKSAVHYPTQMYDSYTAHDSQAVDVAYARDRQRFTVIGARKSATFYFNPLGADGFDLVVNPVVVEPVVQFTFYLKMKYEVEQTKAK